MSGTALYGGASTEIGYVYASQQTELDEHSIF